jgi:hypothetical protein
VRRKPQDRNCSDFRAGFDVRLIWGRGKFFSLSLFPSLKHTLIHTLTHIPTLSLSFYPFLS